MEKVWKPIQQQPEYSVSSAGEVMNNSTGHIKKLRKDKDGYLRVTLYPSGKTISAHRLVMTNHTPKSEWKKQVNHKDFDKTNNNIDNLEWNTPKENIQHKHLHGRNPDIRGSKHPMAKLDDEDVYFIKFKLSLYLSNAATARFYGVSGSTVDRIRNGQAWSHITL